MHQSKLLELLRVLPKKQLAKFESFLKSPYFNKNTDNILFFQYLKKYSPEFTHKKLSKDAVIEKMKLDEKRLAYLMNRQYDSLLSFLSVERYQNEDFQKSFSLLQQFYDLRLDKHYSFIKEKCTKKLLKSPVRNSGFYLKQSLLNRLEYENFQLNRQDFNSKIQNALYSLEQYYQIEKLKYYFEIRNLENVTGANYSLKPTAEILQYIENHGFTDLPIVRIYKTALQLLDDKKDTSYFFRLNDLLIDNENIFSKTELYQMFTFLLNYCIFRINEFNDKQFLSKYLDINKILLEKEMIFERGILSTKRYINLVNTGLKTGEIKWTKQFIEKYKRHLLPESAEDLYNYNLAHYYFYLKNFEKAQILLFNVNFKDTGLNILSRNLLIKTYYEADQEELLFSALEATRIFLIRNENIDKNLKKQQQKFIEYTTKLAKIDNVTANKLLSLKDKLPDTQGIMHRDWILEKILEKEKRVF